MAIKLKIQGPLGIQQACLHYHEGETVIQIIVRDKKKFSGNVLYSWVSQKSETLEKVA